MFGWYVFCLLLWELEGMPGGSIWLYRWEDACMWPPVWCVVWWKVPRAVEEMSDGVLVDAAGGSIWLYR
jgi:hypothetical protein